MYRISTYVFVFFLGVICAFKASAETDPQTIRLVTFEYPPLFHTSKIGKFSGTVGETVIYVCEHAGYNCEVEPLPFKRAYQKIENKHADGLITINVDKFKQCCIASDWQTPWIAGFFTYEDEKTVPTNPDGILNNNLIVVAGMRSPYEYMPLLDEWYKDRKINLFTANGIYSASKMFLSKRAKFLWGSEDFYWYFDKIKGDKSFTFHPRVSRPIVVWARHEQQDFLKAFNKSYAKLAEMGTFGETGLLNDKLMKQNYIDAPFDFSEK